MKSALHKSHGNHTLLVAEKIRRECEADRIMRASLKARADILEWEALELVQKAHELREAVNRLENAS